MAIEVAAAQPQVHRDERDSAALAALLDPAALERRLVHAREQRAAALAARNAAIGTSPAPSRPVPSSEAPRRLLPLPPRSQRPFPETVAPSKSLAPTVAAPAITPVSPPIQLPPLVAERRLPPLKRRRVLPGGVLIGFAAGAVAALAAVVVLEPRLDLRTWTGAPPTETPSAATSPTAAAPPVMFAEVVVVPPPSETPAEASAGPGPATPDRTPADEVPAAIVVKSPTALGSAGEAVTVSPGASGQELLAPFRAESPAPLAPEGGGDIPASARSGAAAESSPALVDGGAPTGDDAPAVAFANRNLRLIVHAPNGASGADVDAALTLLAGTVAPPEGPIQVNYAISTSNVRYYHAEDADAAVAAAASLSNRLGPVETRDFTGYQPSPAPGTIEVWLSGVPVNPARTARGGNAISHDDRQPATPIFSGLEPQTVVPGIPDLVQSVGQEPPVVYGIPNLVQSVVQNQAIQSANAARAAAQAEESARRFDGGIGNALRRAFGAP